MTQNERMFLPLWKKIIIIITTLIVFAIQIVIFILAFQVEFNREYHVAVYYLNKDNGTHYPTLSANGEVTYTSCNHPVHGFKTGKHERLPYPATEIRLNSEIVQNPGF